MHKAVSRVLFYFTRTQPGVTGGHPRGRLRSRVVKVRLPGFESWILAPPPADGVTLTRSVKSQRLSFLVCRLGIVMEFRVAVGIQRVGMCTARGSVSQPCVSFCLYHWWLNWVKGVGWPEPEQSIARGRAAAQTQAFCVPFPCEAAPPSLSVKVLLKSALLFTA